MESLVSPKIIIGSACAGIVFGAVTEAIFNWVEKEKLKNYKKVIGDAEIKR